MGSRHRTGLLSALQAVHLLDW